MRLRDLALAFGGGVVAAHWLPGAHSLWLAWALAGGCAAPLAFGRARWQRGAGVAVCALLGLGWGGWSATDALTARLAPGCETADVTGRVADLPAAVRMPGQRGPAQRFALAPETASCPLGGVVRLFWAEGPPVGAGQRWRLRVRLRPPRAPANRHGFDVGRWQARDRLAATGYVLRGERLVDGNGAAARLGGARQALKAKLTALPLVNGGVLAALTLGDSAAVPRQDIGLYRRTGTMHLLVISGLHVGVVTGLAFFLGRAGAALVGLPALGVRIQAAGVALALLCAIGYVALAGAGLPLVRAFAMAMAGLVALAVGRSVPPSAVLAYALAAVLAVDPMAPLASGFWLSFGAVAILVCFFAPRRGQRSWVRSALAAQLAIALVFTPATVHLIGLAHPLSVIVNMVAVPVVTLAVVPLALCGVALIDTAAGHWLLLGADFGVALLGQVLALADRVAPIYLADPGPWFAVSVAAAVAVLLPVSRLAVAALAAAALAATLRPPLAGTAVPAGEVEVLTLDVGQGTSVLVRTATHHLLYDTGAAFATGGDAGERVVLPSLRGVGIRGLDALVLSHGDNDHVGGAAAVRDSVPVGVIWAGEPVPGIAAAPCRAGQRWRWDDVEFAFLHPRRDPKGGGRDHGGAGGAPPRGNNASCVLLVTATGAAPRRMALLAGDIEAAVERRLAPPRVDWLLVPHHGSATSSTAAFVAATRPRFAVVGTRWNNRFGHPHPDVIARYRASGAHIVSTAVSGALLWRSDRPHAIVVERCRGSRYWRRYPGADRDATLNTALLPCG